MSAYLGQNIIPRIMSAPPICEYPPLTAEDLGQTKAPYKKVNSRHRQSTQQRSYNIIPVPQHPSPPTEHSSKSACVVYHYPNYPSFVLYPLVKNPPPENCPTQNQSKLK